MKRYVFWPTTALLYLIIACLPSSSATQTKDAESAPPSKSATVMHLILEGTIYKGTVDLLEATLTQARTANADAILISLDTPGGMLDATRDLVKLMLNSNIPIIVYVSPSGSRAGSAGTFITLAAHVAAMAPGTNIGAAHPVTATGEDPEKSGKHLAQKIENDTTAFIRTIANQRGRNVEWAEKAVLESDSIDENKALSLKVIDLVASSNQDLLNRIDGRKVKLDNREVTLNTKNATLRKVQIDLGLKFKNWLADPTIMFLLLMVAGLGLYMEFSNPGLIIPGAVGGIAVLLLLVANSMIPLSALGLLLFVAAFALLISEVYVGSFGILAALGVIAFIVAAYFLFDKSDGDIRLPNGLIWGSAAGLASVAAIIGYSVGRTINAKQTAGMEGMIDMLGSVVKDIPQQGEGKVFANGEYWNAKAKTSLAAGTTVRIVKFDGLTVWVASDEQKEMDDSDNIT